MRVLLGLCGLLVIGAGCASTSQNLSDSQAQNQFWNTLTSLCDKAYRGRVVQSAPEGAYHVADEMIMHVRQCDGDKILIPLHAGADHSRVWVLAKNGGLELKHHHFEEDGSSVDPTRYGGSTREAGTATEQRFYPNAETTRMVPSAANTVWTIEVHPQERFIYTLTREGSEQRFQAEFDLTEPVEAPPKPWGP